MRFNKWICIVFLSLSCILTGCQSSKPKKDPNIVSVNPKAAELNVQLGMAYMSQGDMDRAKSKLLYAMKQDPKSTLALSAMAYYLEVTDDIPNAEAYHQRALSMAPKEGRILNNYGTFLCRQKRYEDAEKYLLQAATDINYLSVAGAYENAGLCAKSVADVDKAYYYFRKAVLKDPNRSTAIAQIVHILVKKQDYLHAQRYYERYAKLNGDSAQSLYFATKIFKGLGEDMEAESYQRKLKMKFPDSKEAKLLKV